MDASDFDFAGLGKTLLDTEVMNDFSRRGAALAPYRAELALLMIGLHKAQVVGSVDRPPDPAELCDSCGVMLLDNGLYIDGSVQNAGGMWANMCMTCFLAQGKGIGWGIGQLYVHDGVGWQCIAGGSSHPLEDDDE